MNKLKNEKINSLIIIVAFVFNILIFAPIELFLTNRNEFWFNIKDILPVLLFSTFGTSLILGVVFLVFKGKTLKVVKTIVFSLLLCLYIQGNYLNFNYDVLTGDAIDWNAVITKGIINTVVIVIIFLIPFIIRLIKKGKLFNIISSCTALLILGIQIITLGTVAILNKVNKTDVKVGLNNNNIFNFSKDENIIVLMADTFEGRFMDEILEKEPNIKDQLKDFIYFNNCTAPSLLTYSSLPMLLTGQEMQVGKTLQENLENCFNNSITYKTLKDNGYSTELYLEKNLTTTASNADNLDKNTNVPTKFETKIELGKKLYKCVLYRYMPHFLKQYFYTTGYDFNEIKSKDVLLKYKSDTYYLDDVQFNNVLVSDGIETNDNKKSFKFYELNGLHSPLNTTKNLVYDNSSFYQLLPNEKRRYNEGLATLKLLTNYVNELKKSGIYDNTTIILMADHGTTNRFHSTLLVKKANANQDFTVNSAPVSLLEDLTPTLLNIATHSKNYGKDIFDYQEGEERTRNVLDFAYSTHNKNNNTYKPVAKLVFSTKGLAVNKDSYYISEQEYENENKQLTEKYSIGNRINFKNIINSNDAIANGFFLEDIADDIEAGYNISKNCFLEIMPEKTSKDITANCKILKVFEKDQVVNFKIDGELIYSCILEENSEISFKIPKDIWNKNDTLKIEIEFPDAYLGLYDVTTMTVAHFDYIMFNN